MNVFEQAALEYDEWFETHKWVCQSELEAVRRFTPKTGERIENGKIIIRILDKDSLLGKIYGEKERKANFIGIQILPC